MCCVRSGSGRTCDAAGGSARPERAGTARERGTGARRGSWRARATARVATAPVRAGLGWAQGALDDRFAGSWASRPHGCAALRSLGTVLRQGGAGVGRAHRRRRTSRGSSGEGAGQRFGLALPGTACLGNARGGSAPSLCPGGFAASPLRPVGCARVRASGPSARSSRCAPAATGPASERPGRGSCGSPRCRPSADGCEGPVWRSAHRRAPREIGTVADRCAHQSCHSSPSRARSNCCEQVEDGGWRGGPPCVQGWSDRRVARQARRARCCPRASSSRQRGEAGRELCACTDQASATRLGPRGRRNSARGASGGSAIGSGCGTGVRRRRASGHRTRKSRARRAVTCSAWAGRPHPGAPSRASRCLARGAGLWPSPRDGRCSNAPGSHRGRSHRCRKLAGACPRSPQAWPRRGLRHGPLVAGSTCGATGGPERGGHCPTSSSRDDRDGQACDGRTVVGGRPSAVELARDPRIGPQGGHRFAREHRKPAKGPAAWGLTGTASPAWLDDDL